MEAATKLYSTITYQHSISDSVALWRGELTTHATLEKEEPKNLQGSRGREDCTRRSLVHRGASHDAVGVRTTGVRTEEHGLTSTLMRGIGI